MDQSGRVRIHAEMALAGCSSVISESFIYHLRNRIRAGMRELRCPSGLVDFQNLFGPERPEFFQKIGLDVSSVRVHPDEQLVIGRYAPVVM